MVAGKGLNRSLRVLLLVCQAFEMNLFPVRTCPYGEPQLGRRGLYGAHRLGMEYWSERPLDILTWADGTNDMIDIAQISGFPSDLDFSTSSSLAAKAPVAAGA